MKFEYDPAKSRANLAKHGIDFIEAQKLWQGVMVVFPSRQTGERRELAVGMLDGRGHPARGRGDPPDQCTPEPKR